MATASMLPFMPQVGMNAMRAGLRSPQVAAAAKPKPTGLGGMDLMTWMALSGALAQGVDGGWSAAAPGVLQALQGRKDRQDQDAQSEAQKRAMALMQMGDMKGAIAVLGSAKGLETDAFNMGLRMHDRDEQRGYDDAREERLYRRDRGDYVADRDDERAYDREEGDRRYGIERGDQVEDREDNQRHDERMTTLRASQTERPGWDKITDKDGRVWWVEPGTSNRVDSGIDAPGAQSRSLLGAEAAARAYAGIPGAMESTRRMEDLEKGGYTPDSDWGARAARALPLPFDWNNLWANAVGGDDFQSYTQAFKQFESAMLPIFSGAAVSPTEAERLLKATEPRYGDGEQAIVYKRAQRQRMVESLKAATEGDRTALNAMLEGGGAEASDADEIPTVTTAEQRAQLAPGQKYRAPDGSVRRVPVMR